MNDILNALKLRPGMPKDEVLQDMIQDCTSDLKDMLHLPALGKEHESILKELVLVKVNHSGVEGISSEGFSGVSTTYLDDLPKSLRRKIAAKRKLPR